MQSTLRDIISNLKVGQCSAQYGNKVDLIWPATLLSRLPIPTSWLCCWAFEYLWHLKAAIITPSTSIPMNYHLMVPNVYHTIRLSDLIRDPPSYLPDIQSIHSLSSYKPETQKLPPYCEKLTNQYFDCIFYQLSLYLTLKVRTILLIIQSVTVWNWNRT